MARPRGNPWYAVAFALSGSSCNPLIDVAGAFFPAWILCILIGIAGTAVLRVVFARAGIERGMGPLVVVYPCLATAIALGVWVVFYRS
jgi:hypothetical protein